MTLRTSSESPSVLAQAGVAELDQDPGDEHAVGQGHQDRQDRGLHDDAPAHRQLVVAGHQAHEPVEGIEGGRPPADRRPPRRPPPDRDRRPDPRPPAVGRELEQGDRRGHQQGDHQAQAHDVAGRRHGRQIALVEGHVDQASPLDQEELVIPPGRHAVGEGLVGGPGDDRDADGHGQEPTRPPEPIHRRRQQPGMPRHVEQLADRPAWPLNEDDQHQQGRQAEQPGPEALRDRPEGLVGARERQAPAPAAERQQGQEQCRARGSGRPQPRRAHARGLGPYHRQHGRHVQSPAPLRRRATWRGPSGRPRHRWSSPIVSSEGFRNQALPGFSAGRSRPGESPGRRGRPAGRGRARRGGGTGSRPPGSAWPAPCRRSGRLWCRRGCRRGPSSRPCAPWIAVDGPRRRGPGRSRSTRRRRRAGTSPGCRNRGSRCYTRPGPTRSGSGRRRPRCCSGWGRRLRGTGGRPRPRRSWWG